MPRTRTVLRLVGVMTLASALTIGLTGCLEQAVSQVPTSPPAPVESAPATAAPAGPVSIDPDGTAESNREFFDLTNSRTIQALGAPDGRGFIDALVTAGFPVESMEVTPDSTAIGLQVDNIQFSVLLGDSCLIGQYGNVGYASTVQPVLSTGKCFIGDTRPIDW